MKKPGRLPRSIILGLAGLALGMLEAYRQTNLEPWIVSTSPSGDYRLENVKVSGPFFITGAKGYLRVVSIAEPGQVYRSPLYDWESVDMGNRENADGVGIRWMILRKKEKDFDIAMPGWRECWQNLFISNTPYTIFDNG